MKKNKDDFFLSKNAFVGRSLEAFGLLHSCFV